MLTSSATSVYANMPCVNFGEVLHKVFLPEVRIALEAVLLKLHAKLAPGRVGAHSGKLWSQKMKNDP